MAKFGQDSLMLVLGNGHEGSVLREILPGKPIGVLFEPTRPTRRDGQKTELDLDNGLEASEFPAVILGQGVQSEPKRLQQVNQLRIHLLMIKDQSADISVS